MLSSSKEMGLVVSVVALVGLLVPANLRGRSAVQTDLNGAGQVPAATTMPVPPRVPLPSVPPPVPPLVPPATTMPPLAVSTPHSLVTAPVEHSFVTAPVDFAPRAVVDAAALVGVLPHAIDVIIESDEPDLRGFSGTYYYSFSVTFPWDPRIRSWAWTLDSVAAPGGNGHRGETRAQLSYLNEDGKWQLSLNSGDPYPEHPVLLRATTGPLDKWNSVWGAKWTRVEPIGTMSDRLAMPLIKVSARGTGVIAQWT
jgi:hypothetical protein